MSDAAPDRRVTGEIDPVVSSAKSIKAITGAIVGIVAVLVMVGGAFVKADSHQTKEAAKAERAEIEASIEEVRSTSRRHGKALSDKLDRVQEIGEKNKRTGCAIKCLLTHKQQRARERCGLECNE